MRLHITAIEKLLRAYDTYGGHRGEKKLRNALEQLDFSTYERENGETIRVDSSDLSRETAEVDAAAARAR